MRPVWRIILLSMLAFMLTTITKIVSAEVLIETNFDNAKQVRYSLFYTNSSLPSNSTYILSPLYLLYGSNPPDGFVNSISIVYDVEFLDLSFIELRLIEKSVVDNATDPFDIYDLGYVYTVYDNINTSTFYRLVSLTPDQQTMLFTDYYARVYAPIMSVDYYDNRFTLRYIYFLVDTTPYTVAIAPRTDEAGTFSYLYDVNNDQALRIDNTSLLSKVEVPALNNGGFFELTLDAVLYADKATLASIPLVVIYDSNSSSTYQLYLKLDEYTYNSPTLRIINLETGNDTVLAETALTSDLFIGNGDMVYVKVKLYYDTYNSYMNLHTTITVNSNTYTSSVYGITPYNYQSFDNILSNGKIKGFIDYRFFKSPAMPLFLTDPAGGLYLLSIRLTNDYYIDDTPSTLTNENYYVLISKNYEIRIYTQNTELNMRLEYYLDWDNDGVPDTLLMSKDFSLSDTNRIDTIEDLDYIIPFTLQIFENTTTSNYYLYFDDYYYSTTNAEFPLRRISISPVISDFEQEVFIVTDENIKYVAVLDSLDRLVYSTNQSHFFFPATDNIYKVIIVTDTMQKTAYITTQPEPVYISLIKHSSFFASGVEYYVTFINASSMYVYVVNDLDNPVTVDMTIKFYTVNDTLISQYTDSFNVSNKSETNKLITIPSGTYRIDLIVSDSAGNSFTKTYYSTMEEGETFIEKEIGPFRFIVLLLVTLSMLVAAMYANSLFVTVVLMVVLTLTNIMHYSVLTMSFVGALAVLELIKEAIFDVEEKYNY